MVVDGSSYTHEPVLVSEVVRVLSALPRGSLIVDCTLGKGGHSMALLERGYRVLGIDRDVDAVSAARENLKQFRGMEYVHGNFVNLRRILDDFGVGMADGILVDLGVSTFQLEDEARGFGFRGPLDMRMDQTQELTAETVVNTYSEDELSRVLFEFGEKRFARRIAHAIVEHRREAPIQGGEELLQIVEESMPARYRFSRLHHWATPAFRAIRMEVNKDLDNLEKLLHSFPESLRQGGIMVVISFHSMEDRIVKHRFRELELSGVVQILTKKPVLARGDETSRNPKSARAKLRAIEKLP